MAFNVKIINKITEEVIGQFGPQTVTTVNYEYNGNARKLIVYPSLLQKYPNLANEIANLQDGSTVGFNSVKVIKNVQGVQKEVSEVCSIGPAVAAKTGGGGNWGGKKADPDKDLGAQVGNALTNAAAILGAGKTVAQLEQTAWEIIEAGNRLKAKLKGANTASTQTVAQQATTQLANNTTNNIAAAQQAQQAAHSYVDIDTDIPF